MAPTVVYKDGHCRNAKSGNVSDCKKEGGPEILNCNENEKSRSFWRNYLHEPFLFTFFFSNMLTLNIGHNLTFERACSVNFHRSVKECRGNETLLNEVQIVASDYALYDTLIKFIPSVFIGFFIGPWSDKYGKKPPIYLTIISVMISSAGMLWFVTDESLPLYYSLIVSIPVGFSGGVISCVACIYAMASECTTLQARTMKYAVLELAIAFAIPLSSLAAGYMYNGYGYVPVYLLSFVSFLVPLVLLFFIEDEGQRLEESWQKKLGDFFSFESIKEIIKTVTKPRERKGRTKLLLLFISMLLVILNIFGVSEILFYFCQKMYKWNILYYTDVFTIGSICCTIFVLCLVPLLTKVLKVSDPWIGLIGTVSLMAQQAVRAFAYQPWMYFTSIAVGMSGITAPFAVRSIISKIVDKDELGKVFALLSETESLIPILGALVSTQVYNASVHFFPGLMLLILAILLVFPVVVFIWLAKLPVSDPNEGKSFRSNSEDRL